MTLTIRPATIEDTSIILTLIKELAEYEALLHEVVASEEQLKETLFSEHPHATVLIAEEENNVVGFCLYFYNYSTFLGKYGIYIEDLYIRENYRSKGYGSVLLEYIKQKAKTKNCGRVEWWVLDWNKRAINFYKTMGAKAMDQWTVFRLEDI